LLAKESTVPGFLIITTLKKSRSREYPFHDQKTYTEYTTCSGKKSRFLKKFLKKCGKEVNILRSSWRSIFFVPAVYDVLPALGLTQAQGWQNAGGVERGRAASLAACCACGFFALDAAKNPDCRAAFGVCGVKNRLIGDFLGFYVRSATNS
jgi:hypothetical protein